MRVQFNAYSTRRSYLSPDFADEVIHRSRWADDELNAELDEHLNGFQGWVWQSGGGQMTGPLYALLTHIGRVQTHYAFQVDETDQSALDALGAWATQANAILFTELGTVVDPAGQELISADPEQPAAGRVPVLPEATSRAERIRAWLASQQVRVSPTLPPVLAADEVVAHSPTEVALRTLSLAITAEFALITEGEADPEIAESIRGAFPRAFAALSPAEQAFFAAPDPKTAVSMSWRWEAVRELLWALGRVDLDWPSEPVNVELLRAASLAHHEDVFIDSAQLRGLGELLDEQERNRALLWALREHQHFDGPPAGTANIEIVSERQEAINWLLSRGADWDEIDIPT